MRLYLASAFALLLAFNSTQAVADPLSNLVVEDEFCANYFQARKTGQKTGILDQLICEENVENNEAKLHFEFKCKAGLFNKTETYQVYGNWKTSKGDDLDNMSPWYFIPIEASEERERTLVIHETKLSAAMVTKTRRFSNSKGYYWDEEKFYCQQEHFDH